MLTRVKSKWQTLTLTKKKDTHTHTQKKRYTKENAHETRLHWKVCVQTHTQQTFKSPFVKKQKLIVCLIRVCTQSTQMCYVLFAPTIYKGKQSLRFVLVWLDGASTLSSSATILKTVYDVTNITRSKPQKKKKTNKQTKKKEKKKNKDARSGVNP